jgi:hypothetical protein
MLLLPGLGQQQAVGDAAAAAAQGDMFDGSLEVCDGCVGCVLGQCCVCNHAADTLLMAPVAQTAHSDQIASIILSLRW